MPHTETFYIDRTTEEPLPVQDNPREYLHMDGKYFSQSIMIIEVFAHAAHRAFARHLYQALKKTHVYASFIRIET